MRNISIYVLDKISVDDFVKVTLKANDMFGIEGYNLPRHEPIKPGVQNAFAKEKGKNFAEVEASLTKNNPGPGQY
jgi:hypothetical protein